ncbi:MULTISPECIES: helix-turn-helix domain-containing protein [Mammaliicoccus]|uniref:helix-turn-helix domain-containing protein n=1 Tax=Mammaliicoccus TaxID=2803850 RepID=UPI00289C826C|nr:helix-turn-helix transcriptional regulator [Mammaliicoccus sciuri]
MSIGNTIKEIRKQRKLTQQELADELKISRSYLSDIENGNKNPSIKTTEKLAKKLNVSVGYLTSGNKMYSDLTEDEVTQQMIKMNKILNKNHKDKENNIKSNLLEIIQRDLSYLEVHYLNNMYNFYEIEKEQKDNLLSISVLIQQIYQHKGDKDKEIYDDTMNEFSKFLKQYLEIK